MSWTDPESPWQQTQARRVRKHFRWLLVDVILTLVAIGALAWIGRTILVDFAALHPEPDHSTWALILLGLAVPVVVVLLGSVMVIRQYQVERQILRSVPELNGSLCPKCRRTLVGGTDDAACPRCGQVGSTAEVRSFWEGYPSEASMPLFRRGHSAPVPGATSLPVSRTPRFVQALQRRPAYGVLYFVGIWVVIGSLISWISGGSLLVNMLRMSWGIVLSFAFCLWALGHGRREGTSSHCANCGYEQAKDETVERCPECGHRWLEPSGAVRGRVLQKPVWKWAGAVVFATVIGLMVIPIFFRGSTNALKPTWLLIDEVVGIRGFTMDQWKELGGRGLTRDQELELMQGLLDKRADRGWLSDGDKWLGSMLQADKVPDDLKERYYREMISAEFVDTGRAVVGQPIELTIDLASSDPLSPTEKLVMILDGIYVDDASTPVGRATRQIDVWRLPEADFRHHRLSVAKVVPQRPGPMRARLVFWHLYTPAQYDAGPIDWSEDRPVLPPGTIWSRRVEIETVIDVSAP